MFGDERSTELMRRRISDHHAREAAKARAALRTEAAIAAMQALIQAGHRDPVRAAADAFRYADAFMTQLDSVTGR